MLALQNVQEAVPADESMNPVRGFSSDDHTDRSEYWQLPKSHVPTRNPQVSTCPLLAMAHCNQQGHKTSYLAGRASQGTLREQSHPAVQWWIPDKIPGLSGSRVALTILCFSVTQQSIFSTWIDYTTAFFSKRGMTLANIESHTVAFSRDSHRKKFAVAANPTFHINGQLIQSLRL